MQLSADDWPNWPEHHQAHFELPRLVAVALLQQANCWRIRHHAKPRAVADRIEGTCDSAIQSRAIVQCPVACQGPGFTVSSCSGKTLRQCFDSTGVWVGSGGAGCRSEAVATVAPHHEAVANSVDNTKLPICRESTSAVADQSVTQALRDAVLLGLPLPSGAVSKILSCWQRAHCVVYLSSTSVV